MSRMVNDGEKSFLRKFYEEFVKIVLAMTILVVREIVNNDVARFVLLILSMVFLGPVLYQVATYYLFEYGGKLSKYKRGILFFGLGLIFLIIFGWLYYHEGGLTSLFLGTCISSVVAYLIALVLAYKD